MEQSTMDIEQICAPAFSVEVFPDGQFRYSGINASNHASTGLTNDLIKGRSPADCHQPEVAATLVEHYRRCVETRALVEYETTAELPAGITCWRTSLMPVVDGAGVVTTLIGVCKDVTSIKRQQRAIETTNTHLTLAIEALNGAHWQFDVVTGEIVASRSLALLMGEAAPRDVPWSEWAARVVKEDLQHAGCDRLVSGQVQEEVVRFRYRGRDDETRWAQCRRSILRGDAPGAATICGVIVDVTEERRRELQLEHEANRDPLTGLLNRRGFRHRVDEVLSDAAADVGLGVLVLDLDGFKAINDRYGHGIGDDVLVETGRRLTTMLGARGVCARLGGDEFAVMMPAASVADIDRAQRDVTALLRQPLMRRGQSIPMAASVGRAHGGFQGAELGVLMTQADNMLYAIKRARRERTTLRGVQNEPSVIQAVL